VNADLIRRRYFHDYVAFFESEMDKKGWQAVVNEYLFSRDERSDDLLIRMFAGTVHIYPQELTLNLT
jgi:hypothetical protein